MKMEEDRVKVQEINEAPPEKKKGRKALMALVAVIASASVSLAGFFSEPAALLDRDIKIPSAQVNVIVDDDDDEGDENEEKENKQGFSEKARAFILRIPLVIRGTVGVVMWALGWVIIRLAMILWIGILSPALGFLLRTLLTFLILAAVVAAVLKLLFPWLRFKDILSKRNIIFLLVMSVLLNVFDTVLPFVWDGYKTVRNTVLFLFYMFVTITAVISASSRIRKLKDAVAVLAK